MPWLAAAVAKPGAPHFLMEHAGVGKLHVLGDGLLATDACTAQHSAQKIPASASIFSRGGLVASRTAQYRRLHKLGTFGSSPQIMNAKPDYTLLKLSH
jgi:hypothetical protein